MKEAILPISVILLVGSLLLPLPAGAIDFLLVINVSFSILLVGAALYLGSPLALSSLPSIILIATLFRLALNVSTTRLILGGGEMAAMIETFGQLLMNRNLVVGVVVFLVLTLVQFIVIAKGAERVAEVSARFTLDALPGKQMSIDADVRSGLLSIDEARERRDELQVESRFYGALDGAMKFVKGDSIVGIFITIANVLGGLTVGVGIQGMAFGAAVHQYTLFTVGDGLLSQIPALLTSLAAAMVVTRVSRDDDSSLSFEVADQLGHLKKALQLTATLLLLLAFVSPSPAAFGFIGTLLLVVSFSSLPDRKKRSGHSLDQYTPPPPSLLAVEVGTELAKKFQGDWKSQWIELFQQSSQTFHRETGLLLPIPVLRAEEERKEQFRLLFREVPLRSVTPAGEAESVLQEIQAEMLREMEGRKVELVNDIQTRKLLDILDSSAPELVSHVVPGLVSVTQLTTLLRELVREEVSVYHLDLILQAVSECAGSTTELSTLEQESRAALARFISRSTAPEGVLSFYRLEGVLDLVLAEAHRSGEPIEEEVLSVLFRWADTYSGGEDPVFVCCSKYARKPLSLALTERGVRVLAYEEVEYVREKRELGVIEAPQSVSSICLERMAA